VSNLNGSEISENSRGVKGLVRFIPTSTNEITIGQPADHELDVGAAVRAGEEVDVVAYTGSSVLAPGIPNGKVEVIGKLLSPLAESEVGTIRCIGLNVSRIQPTIGIVADYKSTLNMSKKPRWKFLRSQQFS